MKNLSDRIAAFAKEVGSKRGRQVHHAAFLRHKDEIFEAAAQGWGIKAIWATLKEEGEFSGTYECFLKYFREYVENKGIQIDACRECPYRKLAGGLYNEGKTNIGRGLAGTGWRCVPKRIENA